MNNTLSIISLVTIITTFNAFADRPLILSPNFGQQVDYEAQRRSQEERRRKIEMYARETREKQIEYQRMQENERLLRYNASIQLQENKYRENVREEEAIRNDYIRQHQQTNSLNNVEYHRINGYTVHDVLSHGARISVGGNDYFVYGLTGVYSDRSYGELLVMNAGSLTYYTVMGAARHIPAYRVLSEEEELQIKNYTAYYTKIRKEADQIIAARREALKQHENERQMWYNKALQQQGKEAKWVASLKIFQFRQEQATNGLPTAQYQIGKAYLEGDENCQTNKMLGIYWLTKSAEQGNTEAKELLQKQIR